MSLDVLGKPTIVFNSLKSAFEVLERRARNSSGRPRFIMAGEILTGELLPGPVETNQEGHAAFGFGRRMCVGKYMANDSLFIHTAGILWAATLECVQDENGEDVVPDINSFVDMGLIM